MTIQTKDKSMTSVNELIIGNALSPHANFMNLYNEGYDLPEVLYTILDNSIDTDDRYSAATMLSIGDVDKIYSDVDRYGRRFIIIGLDATRSIIVYERYAQGDEGFITADYPNACGKQVFGTPILTSEERLTNKDLFAIKEHVDTNRRGPLLLVDCDTCPTSCEHKPVPEWDWTQYLNPDIRAWHIFTEEGHNEIFEHLLTLNNDGVWVAISNATLERADRHTVLQLLLTFEQRIALGNRVRGYPANDMLLSRTIWSNGEISIQLIAQRDIGYLPRTFQLTAQQDIGYLPRTFFLQIV